MNNTMKKILIFVLFALLLCAITSCSDILKSGNSYGFITINLDLQDIQQEPGIEDLSAHQDNSRTVFPGTSTANNYHFKFIGYTSSAGTTTNGKIVERSSVGNNPGAVSLETGFWKVSVTRFETSISNPVQFGTSPVFEITAGATAATTVFMDHVSGGEGTFSYKIVYSPGGAVASLQLQAVNGGDPYGFSSQTVPLGAGGLSGSLNVPAGSYDATVTLIKDGKTAKMYETVIVYSGLTSFWNLTFDANQFYNNVYIGGTVNVVFPAGISPGPGNNITITAYKTGTSSPAVGTGNFAWNGAPLNWIIPVDPNIPSVDLTVLVSGTGGPYTFKNIVTVDAIPVTGKFDINLVARIFDITIPKSWGTLASISPRVGGIRTAASPGEKVDLNITSSYGLKTGSVNVKHSSAPYTEIPVSSSGGNYSFIMPEAAVSIDAVFNTLLESLSIVDANTGTPVDLFAFYPETFTYYATVPIGVTGIKISAAVKDSLATITGSVDPAISSLAFGVNKITIGVIPQGGVPSDEKEYTIYLTREPYLETLAVTSYAALPFASNITTYNVSGVPYSTSSCTVTATAPLGVTIVGASGSGVSHLLNASAPTVINVFANAGGLQKTYSITVTKLAASTINTLSSIELTAAGYYYWIDNSSSPPLAPTITLPTNIDNSVSSVSVIATPTDPLASVTVFGSNNLMVGNNTIIINVVAESGSSNVYTLYIIKDP